MQIASIQHTISVSRKFEFETKRHKSELLHLGTTSGEPAQMCLK